MNFVQQIHFFGPIKVSTAEMFRNMLLNAMNTQGLKGIEILNWPFGLPEFIASAAVAALHAWKKNSLLSIGAGTVLYMVLVQLVF